MKKNKSLMSFRTPPSKIELLINKDSEPINLMFQNSSSFNGLCSVFGSIFDSPNHMFSIKSCNDRSIYIDLINPIKDFPKEKQFWLQMVPIKRNYDDLYEKLKEKGIPIVSNFRRDTNQSMIPGEINKEEYSYESSLKMTRILARSIIDVVRDDDSTLFPISVVQSLCNHPMVSFYSAPEITNALTEVMIELFGDSCLWDIHQDPDTVPYFKQFIGILIQPLCESGLICKSLHRALFHFAPTAFSESIIYGVTKMLKTRMNPQTAYSILNSVFPTSFVVKSFRSREHLNTFIFENNYVNEYPYVALRLLVQKWTIEQRSAKTVALMISQLGCESLFTSKLVVKSIIDPVLDMIYDDILDSDLPYLEMTESQMLALTDKLESGVPIFKAVFKKDVPVQVEALNRITDSVAKRNFEPKGLLLVLFTFLYQNGIITSMAYNKWLSMRNEDQPFGKQGASLEINTGLMNIIPPPVPQFFPRPDKITKK